MTSLQHAARIINRPAQYGRDNTAIASRHLTLRESVLRMTLEPRVVDALDLGMLLQELSDS